MQLTADYITLSVKSAYLFADSGGKGFWGGE
jgi:hypothetical protein